MRVYLPATVPLLREWLANGSARPAGAAFGVTPSLREWYGEGDLDELEHQASLLAADASLALAAADPVAPARRVVLAVEVDDASLTADRDEPGSLQLREPVLSKRWASALIDDSDVAPEEAEAVDLGWYAIQELSYLFAEKRV